MRISIIFVVLIMLSGCACFQSKEKYCQPYCEDAYIRPVEHDVTVTNEYVKCDIPEKMSKRVLVKGIHVASKENIEIITYNLEEALSYISRLENTVTCYNSQAKIVDGVNE